MSEHVVGDYLCRECRRPVKVKHLVTGLYELKMTPLEVVTHDGDDGPCRGWGKPPLVALGNGFVWDGESVTR